MTEIQFIAAAVSVSTSPPTGDLGRLLVWIAVPAVILATVISGLIKRAVLSRPVFLSHRPSFRTFVWVGLADMVAWAVLWPALLVVRVQGADRGGALWIVALLLVVALGYVANRYGFGRAFDPAVAGSMKGTMLAELFTIMMPMLAVVFGLLIFWVLSVFGGAN